MGMWATKVTSTTQNKSGVGSFTITTIQGKRNKKISFIAAYIAVQEVSNMGFESFYAQQSTIHE
jgi:hypothetical protein